MTYPAAGLAQARNSTLVILDMQTRATATVGDEDCARVFRAASRALRTAELLSVPVIYTEHCAPPLGATDPRLVNVLPRSAYRVQKHTYCAWADDSFANAVEIAARSQIVICGLQAHIGVVQTAITMAEHGYPVFVVADGIGSHDPALAANALHRMRASAVNVISCESLLYEWLEGSDATTRDDVLAILQET